VEMIERRDEFRLSWEWNHDGNRARRGVTLSLDVVCDE